MAELIGAMIINSDNGAKDLLLDNLDQAGLGVVSDIFTDIGLSQRDQELGNLNFTVRSYSLILRILYNATYLSHQYSNEALSILSQAVYHDGIVAGVPAGTMVAQKFGEYVAGADGQRVEPELHNCGIVYRTGGNYLLCIMTKGQSIDQLTTVIKDISSLVYNEVSSNNQK
ncbi:MAG: serine hydrolase [Candidatus Komeilibacteria bacterium]|nr:serine hydrolase [Candidatus Komeilibacteria bacterium]